MKRALIPFVIAVASMAVAGTADAGRKTTYGTDIFLDPTGWGYASTQLGSARASSNNVDQVVCYFAHSKGSTPNVACVFNNPTYPTGIWSHSSDPGIINTLRTMRSDDAIMIAWNENAEISTVSLNSGSSYLPKTP
jgi:hypothetical protein